MTQQFTLAEIKNFTDSHFAWAYENYKLDQKDDFDQKKDIFEAVKPWLDREQFDYIEKQKKVQEEVKEEISKEAREAFKAHMDKLGIELPEGAEVEVHAEGQDEESSEVVE